VLEDPTKNTEEYLVTRATQLQKLPSQDLDSLAEKGKQALKGENEEQVAEIRKKYKVE
jgi:hypothetical protein